MSLQLESYLWAKSRKKLEPKYWKIHNFMKSFNYLTKYTFITFSFKLVKLWTDENETGWPALTEFRWNTVDRYEFLGNFEALAGNVKYCIGHIIWRNVPKLINRSYLAWFDLRVPKVDLFGFVPIRFAWLPSLHILFMLGIGSNVGAKSVFEFCFGKQVKVKCAKFKFI